MGEKEKKQDNRAKIPPKIQAPKVQLRPEVRDNIDYFAEQIVPKMTTHELQYLLQKLGLMPALQQRQPAKTKKQVLDLNLDTTKQKPVEAIEPLREFDESMRIIEKRLTRGFSEPRLIVPLNATQETENPMLNMILRRVDRFLDKVAEDPETSQKLGLGLARLVDAIATKIEEAGRGVKA